MGLTHKTSIRGKLKDLLSYRSEARALLYAVFISFFSAVTIGGILLFTQYRSLYIDKAAVENTLKANVESALLYAFTTDSLRTDRSITFDLYGKGTDSVCLTERVYGLYRILNVKAFRNRFSLERKVLAGIDGQNEQTAIYLPDQNNKLFVCGSTYIKGNCFLPKKGVEKGCVGTNNFLGDRLVNGSIFQSEKKLPEFNKETAEYLEAIFNKAFHPDDSVINLDPLYFPDSLENSFLNKTLVIHCNGLLKLNGSLKGNLIIYSGKGIVIGSKARLKDPVIVAPYIEIEPDFEGSAQFIASDSIRVHDNAKINPGSTFCIYNKSSQGPVTLSIDKDCRVAGALILYTERASDNAFITVDENSEIYGTIYCNGFTELKQSFVYGTVYTENFLSRSNSFQSNKLEDVVIDRSRLPVHYTGPVIFNMFQPKKIIKWCY